MSQDQDQPDTDAPAPGEQTGSGAAATGAATAGDGSERRFRIQKLFLKDVSFESPAAPGIFSRDSDVQPKVTMQLNTENRQVGENLYEIVLGVTVTSADDEHTAFLVEVKQAGLFEISGFPDVEHAHAIGSYCPSILFPFAREVVAGLVQKGGFPQVSLQPVNFDALFAQQLQKEKQRREQAAGEGDAATDTAAEPGR